MKKSQSRAPMIDLRQRHGPLQSYWTAVVRRGPKGPILFDNTNSSRDAALGGAQTWCRNQGYSNVKVREIS